MATRRQPLAFGWLLPGLTAAIVLVVVALAAFLALWFSAPETSWNALIRDSYLWHVVRFSFWQAFLSALFFGATGDIPRPRPVPASLPRAHAAAAPLRDDLNSAGTGGGLRHS